MSQTRPELQDRAREAGKAARSFAAAFMAAIVVLAVVMWGGASHAQAAAGQADSDHPFLAAAPALLAAEHEHHEHSGEPGGGPRIGLGEALAYAARIAYYLLLLPAAGLPLLGLLLPAGDRYETLARFLAKWSGAAAKGLLLAVIAYVFVHSTRMAEGLGGGDAWPRLFTETAAGQSWLALTALAVLGLAAVRLPEPLKAAWALLLLAAESFNGHAATAEQVTVAIVADFIHLAASSLWAGGVMALLLLWRFERKEAGRFAERFAAVAWISIAALAATGIAMTWTLVPSWHYVLYTDWGRWLLAKSALVALVALTGAALRRRAKSGDMPRGALLKLDGSLMAGIVAIVTVFTFVSPSPNSEPLYYHRMGEELHYTLRLEPNAPGPNAASLIVWLPEETGGPRELSLLFLPGSRPEGPAVPAVLSQAEARPGEIEFPGFKAYYFKAENVSLPRPGEWTAELAIEDGTGERNVFTVSFDNR